MPVVAHPDSAKAELAWSDWDLPVAGLEWMNLDSGWRDESRPRLVRAAIDSFVRPGPALASLQDRPAVTLARWDEIGASRTMVGLAGHDAHGGWSRRTEEGSRWRVPGFLSGGVASYDSSFATFAIRAVLDQRLTGDAARDARLVLDATRAGHIYTAVDAIAGPAWVDYRGTHGTRVVGMGDVLTFVDGTVLTFRSTLPAGAAAVLLRDGVEVATSDRGELRFTAPGPGAYRVEVRAPRWAVPWVVTNPIYLRAVETAPPGPAAAAVTGSTVLELTAPGLVEKDPRSTAELFSSESGMRGLTFSLLAGERVSQYAALAVPLPQGVPCLRPHRVHRPIGVADARLGPAPVRERRRGALAALRLPVPRVTPNRRTARPSAARRPTNRQTFVRSGILDSLRRRPDERRARRAGKVRDFRPPARQFPLTPSTAELRVTQS